MDYSATIIKLLVWLCVATVSCGRVAAADAGFEETRGNAGDATTADAAVSASLSTDVLLSAKAAAMKKPVAARVMMEEGQASSADAEAVRHWAEEFYLKRPLCGTSEVSDVIIRKNSIVVSLDIEPKWEAALSNLGQDDAARWFAIHCPLPVGSVASKVGQRDILVVSTNADNPHTDFSCREFERAIRAEAVGRETGIRARVNALLDRLGMERSP
jgi:hypothetical protein